jgi:hypothetical protein
MSFAYKCPGTTTYGRTLSARTVHGGCCAAFALMSQERRRRIGIRYLVYEPIICVDEDAEGWITTGELIEVVALLQLAADDGVDPPVAHRQHVLVEPDFPKDELDALLDLGAAYGLQVRVTWLPADRAG